MNPIVTKLGAVGKAMLPLIPQAGAARAAVEAVSAVVDLYNEVKKTTLLSPAEIEQLDRDRAQFEAAALAEGRALSARLGD